MEEEFNDLIEKIPEEVNRKSEILEKEKELNLDKSLNAYEVYNKFKDYYYDLSHSKYYSIKQKMDRNVILKKKLREEFVNIQNLRAINYPSISEKLEIKRISDMIDSLKVEDEKEESIHSKALMKKIEEIEERISLLKKYVSGM